MERHIFSSKLDAWLRSKKPKTIGGLIDEFQGKSFAILILVLMLLPALPVPTGFVSHICEVITLVLAVEMIIGRRSIWLPKSMLQRSIGGVSQRKAIPFISRRIRWLEKYSRPRLSGWIDNQYYWAFLGVLIFILTLGALLAIPFSGLDTLPSMGVVIIALSIILEDVPLVVLGALVGAVGVGLEIGLGLSFTHFLTHLPWRH